MRLYLQWVMFSGDSRTVLTGTRGAAAYKRFPSALGFLFTYVQSGARLKQSTAAGMITPEWTDLWKSCPTRRDAP